MMTNDSSHKTRKPPEPKSGIIRYAFGYTNKFPWFDIIVLSVMLFVVVVGFYKGLHR